jgi:hypothetical protein
VRAFSDTGDTVRAFGRSGVLKKSVGVFGGSVVRWFFGIKDFNAVGIERFEDLRSWQEARKLVRMIFRFAANERIRLIRGDSSSVSKAYSPRSVVNGRTPEHSNTRTLFGSR